MKKNTRRRRGPHARKPLARFHPSKKIVSPGKISRQFPIVALGGSAGGLEAFEEFFKNMPADSGMAFVVIAHLDPSRVGVMPELIQRFTSMKVLQADDKLKILPNTVYVIPSSKDISLMHGVLHLFAPAKIRGLHLPIDTFLRSLAADQGGGRRVSSCRVWVPTARWACRRSRSIGG